MSNTPRRRSRRRSAGFTLIEAVVSIGLVGVSIVATLDSLASMSKTDAVLQDREYLQRLAIQKYDEIVATGAIDTADLSGDFTERNDTRTVWEAEVNPSGVDNVDVLTVTVRRNDVDNGPQAVVDGLVYEAPASTGGTGQ